VRVRSIVVALLVVVIAAMLGPMAARAAVDDHPRGVVVLAQEPETEGQESEDTAEETGAEESQTEGAADETGPPWTYQMARISILLMLVLGLGIAFWYWRLIARRQRSGT
jgi:hypothetical protein